MCDLWASITREILLRICYLGSATCINQTVEHLSGDPVWFGASSLRMSLVIVSHWLADLLPDCTWLLTAFSHFWPFIEQNGFPVEHSHAAHVGSRSRASNHIMDTIQPNTINKEAEQKSRYGEQLTRNRHWCSVMLPDKHVTVSKLDGPSMSVPLCG